MITGSSYRDHNIVSRSFRFMSPNVSNPDAIFKNADYDLETSYFSTAWGDNRFVNPLPGYGFNTDPSPAIAKKGYIKNEYGNLGRYYKRIHDDNATVLTLTAGVAEFSGILPFITNMFDYAASTIANKGRAPSWAFYITQTAAAIAFFPFQLIGVGMNFLNFLAGEPKNEWYYVKPAMGQYLAAAQGIFNDLMVNAGFAITVFNDSRQETGNEARNSRDFYKGTINGYDAKDSADAKQNNIDYMNRLFPDAINKDGTIDIVKIIGRGPRKYRYFLRQLKELDNEVGGNITLEQKNTLIENQLDDLVNNPSFVNGKISPMYKMGTDHYLKQELATTGRHRGLDELTNPEVASAYYDTDAGNNIIPQSLTNQTTGASDTKSLSSVLEKASNIFDYGETPPADSFTASGAQTTTGANTDLTGNIPGSIDVNKNISQESWLGQIGEILEDSFLGGMDSVSFRVEGGVGPVSDSFSNSTKQSELSSMFNGQVSAVNDFKFNVQGGNIGIPVVDTVLNTIKDGVAGIASGSVIGNIPMALLGNARVIVPEHWADSSANLHTESYTIYSEATYGHPYSIAMSVYLPLALILPFVVPISSGGSTYTTPFLVKAFSRGRTVIKKGIVKNCSITFGEGELGWTKDRKPLNIRINLDIADLDPIVSMPVSRIRNPLDVANVAKVSGQYLNSIGKYNDYMTRVAGVDYLDSILKFSQLNRSVTRFANDMQEIFNPSRVSGAINDSLIGTIATIFTNRNLAR